MLIISAIGLYCYDKFEETPNEKAVNMSKLTKPYFRYFCFSYRFVILTFEKEKGRGYFYVQCLQNFLFLEVGKGPVPFLSKCLVLSKKYFPEPIQNNHQSASLCFSYVSNFFFFENA